MPRITKGSDEAKKRMEHLRSLRKTKSSNNVVEAKVETPPESPVKETSDEAIVGTGKKTNSWIIHVRNYAKSHNMNYFEALKDPKLKEGYKK
jgi:hypothetical protein